MNFLNASFRVGRFSGIDVRIHILFVIWAVWRMVDAGQQWPSQAWFMGLLFGIVLVHEFGHCFGARSVGGDARDILLWPLGGLAFAHAPMTPWAQFVTVACGPLVNVVFCLISGVILVALAGTIQVLSLSPFVAVNDALLPAYPWVGYVVLFYWVNYFLLALNLLPIYPLDGGQLFQCLIWPFVGLQRATQIACQVGIAGCVGFGVWGISGGGGGMLIFIAIFGGFTCYQRLQALKYGMIVDERIATYQAAGRYHRREGFWSRLFKRRRARVNKPGPPANPNPGGWEAKQEESRRLDEELDRILKKVSERGIQSLSYVERQTLEHATRERQKREREYQRGGRV